MKFCLIALWHRTRNANWAGHGFEAIRSISDFQRAVPVCGYEEFRGEIERMAREKLEY